MKFEIITLFPEYFEVAMRQSLLGKAIEKRIFDIEIIDLRQFATDKHRTVDDTPFGGGGGMVMKIEPIDQCLRSLGYAQKKSEQPSESQGSILLTSAAGSPFTQKQAISYSLKERLTIICGHYLGVDERLMQLYDVEEISIGDYILTGGEPAALVIVDAIGRLMPGVLGNFESALNDSYMNQLLGSPCFTRPADYEGLEVPSVLLSGNHSEIEQYRRNEAIKRCATRRPDILANSDLSQDEISLVEELSEENDKN